MVRAGLQIRRLGLLRRCCSRCVRTRHSSETVSGTLVPSCREGEGPLPHSTTSFNLECLEEVWRSNRRVLPFGARQCKPSVWKHAGQVDNLGATAELCTDHDDQDPSEKSKLHMHQINTNMSSVSADDLLGIAQLLGADLFRGRVPSASSPFSPNGPRPRLTLCFGPDKASIGGRISSLLCARVQVRKCGRDSLQGLARHGPRPTCHDTPKQSRAGAG